MSTSKIIRIPVGIPTSIIAEAIRLHEASKDGTLDQTEQQLLLNKIAGYDGMAPTEVIIQGGDEDYDDELFDRARQKITDAIGPL